MIIGERMYGFYEILDVALEGKTWLSACTR